MAKTELELRDEAILAARRAAAQAENAPPTPVAKPTVPQEEYVYVFTKADTTEMIAAALEGKAEQWDVEAFHESEKGAANQTMMLTLRWGANQLRDMAAIVRDVPDYEMRMRDSVVPESVTLEQELGLEPIPDATDLFKQDEAVVTTEAGAGVRVNQDKENPDGPRRLVVEHETGGMSQGENPYGPKIVPPYEYEDYPKPYEPQVDDFTPEEAFGPAIEYGDDGV